MERIAKLLPESIRERADSLRAPSVCTRCGEHPPRYRGAKTCLQCARDSCCATRHGYTSDGGTGYAMLSPRGADTRGCESCGGEGWITGLDEQGYSRSSPCPGQGLRDRLAQFNMARFPGRHHDASFATYEAATPNLQYSSGRVLRWAQTVTPGQRGLAICGPNGVGKTHLAVSLGKVLTVERGYTVHYLGWTDLLRQLKESWKPGGAEVNHGRILTAQFLIIDELGNPPVNKEWREEALWTIINRRYGDPTLTTCVISNYWGDALQQRIPRRIYSRLRELTSHLQIVGRDWRDSR